MAESGEGGIAKIFRALSRGCVLYMKEVILNYTIDIIVETTAQLIVLILLSLFLYITVPRMKLAEDGLKSQK